MFSRKPQATITAVFGIPSGGAPGAYRPPRKTRNEENPRQPRDAREPEGSPKGSPKILPRRSRKFTLRVSQKSDSTANRACSEGSDAKCEPGRSAVKTFIDSFFLKDIGSYRRYEKAPAETGDRHTWRMFTPRATRLVINTVISAAGSQREVRRGLETGGRAKSLDGKPSQIIILSIIFRFGLVR